MATARIFNGFGRYEECDGKVGITLTYAGVNFWLPYQEITTIPDFTFREVDHDKSTPQGDSTGELIYKSVIVPGMRIAEELCDKQIPIPYSAMGIIKVRGKATGKMIEVRSGWNDEGYPLTAEVAEHEPTKTEIAETEQLAKLYKEQMVADYFQAKRERMTGGRGALHPAPRVRAYMNELGVEDLDDITAHAKNSGLNPELIKQLMAAVAEETSETNARSIVQAVESIRKAGKAQLDVRQPHGKGLGLAERKAAYDAEHPDEVVKLSTS